MYLAYEKITIRGFPSIITSLFAILLILATLGLTGTLIFSIFYGGFNKGILFFTLILWGETIGTIMTFKANVVDGPNSALLNLPLLACDLVFVVIISNTVITYLDIIDILSSKTVDPNKWFFSNGDFFRIFLFAVVIIRYTGLAWTDHNFFLKRLVAPVRKDEAKEFVPYVFGQVQDPFTMTSGPPMPM